MELDKGQRVILVNQYLILEMLYPEQADGFSRHRKALEEGYTIHYGDIAEFFYDDFPKDKCQFVLDVLDMYRSFVFSYNEMEDTSGLEKEKIRFQGFDGNNEGHYRAYCQHFIVDLERFQELKGEHVYPDFNSHTPMNEYYRGQLEKWKARQKDFRVTKEQLKEILDYKVLS